MSAALNENGTLLLYGINKSDNSVCKFNVTGNNASIPFPPNNVEVEIVPNGDWAGVAGSGKLIKIVVDKASSGFSVLACCT